MKIKSIALAGGLCLLSGVASQAGDDIKGEVIYVPVDKGALVVMQGKAAETMYSAMTEVKEEPVKEISVNARMGDDFACLQSTDPNQDRNDQYACLLGFEDIAHGKAKAAPAPAPAPGGKSLRPDDQRFSQLLLDAYIKVRLGR